jgi:hypothetical protein
LNQKTTLSKKFLTSLYLTLPPLALAIGCKTREFPKKTSDQSELKNSTDSRFDAQKLNTQCTSTSLGSGLVLECKEKNEDSDIQKAADQAVFSIQESYKTDAKASQNPIFKRDVHPISETVPSEFQQGIFSDPGKTYPIWSRVSNSGLTPKTSDEAGDFRGLTFKLLGVPGKKLLPGYETSQNLDFAFVNIPFFVAKNLEEYNAQLSFKQGPNLGNIINAALRTRLLLLTSKALNLSKMVNPLNETYFSITSFQLGDNSVRYRAVPCTDKKALGAEGATGENKFRQAMSKTLKRENGCFDIEVRRLLVPSWKLNEDVTSTWEEHVEDALKAQHPENSEAQKKAAYAQAFSEWSPIAKVDFPVQDFESAAQQTFCENTSFNVWRTLETMRPLGNLNRARKVVYAEVSKSRRRGNKASEVEPNGSENFNSP